jgi:hypothetical protein
MFQSLLAHLQGALHKYRFGDCCVLKIDKLMFWRCMLCRTICIQYVLLAYIGLGMSKSAAPLPSRSSLSTSWDHPIYMTGTCENPLHFLIYSYPTQCEPTVHIVYISYNTSPWHELIINFQHTIVTKFAFTVSPEDGQVMPETGQDFEP